jgi:putative intracellular protease/amidase
MYVLHLPLHLQLVPFLLEDRLKELGAVLQKADADWGELVITDGNLITGQNPGRCIGV